MPRRFLRHLIFAILLVCVIHAAACGHELDPSYEGDWTELEDEIEYRLGDVDLKPVDQVEVEGQDDFDQDVDD